MGSLLWKSYRWYVLENSPIASNSLTVPALRWMLDDAWTLSSCPLRFTAVPVYFTNYRLFVPKTFRSQERKVPMENFRSPGTKVPGTFIPGSIRSPGTKVGTFLPGPFCSRELSFPENESSRELSFLGPFVPGNFRSHYPIGLVAALLCVLNYCMFGCDFTLMMLTPL